MNIDTNVFPKGAYVVLLSSCTGTNNWAPGIPENYVYRLSEDSSTSNFDIEVDHENRENGWGSKDPNCQKLRLRLATDNELIAYINAGKPVPAIEIENYSIY